MSYPGDREQENHESEGFEGEEFEGAWEEDGQLALSGEDDDLPWLEADDYEEESGFDFRLIGVALVGLLVVAALLGAGYWFTRDRPDAEMVPDGSTVAAPEGPYKERPEDGGSSQVAGTGDLAFQTAEGESTRGRIDADDGGDRGAAPSIDVAQADGESTPPAASGGAYVQIGAFGSKADAEAAWSSATQRFSALSGLRHRVIEAEVNGAPVFRLQAVASDEGAANSVCRSIRNSGGDCYVR